MGFSAEQIEKIMRSTPDEIKALAVKEARPQVNKIGMDFIAAMNKEIKADSSHKNCVRIVQKTLHFIWTLHEKGIIETGDVAVDIGSPYGGAAELIVEPNPFL